MVELTVQSALKANLAALGERNAELARKLEQTAPASGLEWTDTPQDVIGACYAGQSLCSRHRPLDEAAKLVSDIDLVEHAVIVVMGFGLGYHVQRLAERLGKAGLIVVFEPDLALLRAVLEQIDHSHWLRDALVLFATDATDRGALAEKLKGAESILAQGIEFLEHPASRLRLGDQRGQFTGLFTDYVSAAKLTLMTTLVRSLDTVRNLLLNLDHYTGGRGLTELAQIAKGHPAIVVSAGPSLRRNVHLLAQPGVRDRCVIIAVQTTLRPLLRAGIKPHFVTALDYHEISRRFYEDLHPRDVEGVTLIADPKAHPVIIDSFPGAVRCCASPFLDRLLGDQARDMGSLPAGATVAHLAVYLAHYLGCNPITTIGQDLGFTDGLYYAPGTAIHDVWAPELNPFNTIEMMEWQRIARHRTHLHKTTDIHGRSIYTDAQMLTYLQQFERDFGAYVRDGIEIIDATEGGVAKQHTKVMPLAEMLDRFATRSLPDLPLPPPNPDAGRLSAARRRLLEVRRHVTVLRSTSLDTSKLLQKMLRDQAQPERMNRHFRQMEKHRRQVEERMDTFGLLNELNQLGTFKRFKADRRLQMSHHLDPVERQRAQLQRDLENVTWTGDAAAELINLLDDAGRLVNGDSVSHRSRPATSLIDDQDGAPDSSTTRVAALIPIDPERGGLGTARALDDRIAGQTVIQWTLERLGRARTLHEIVLVAPAGFDVDAMIDRSRIGLPVEIVRCKGSPFPPEHVAIAASRRWTETSWRGGLAGMSIYDEVLCPQTMFPIMRDRGLTAALLVGPDWPLIDASAESGCDAVVRRYLEHPSEHNLVFTQAPPGLCGCLITIELMEQLADRNRLSTVGAMLVYQPHLPQHDPIARDTNVQIDHDVRGSMVRATYDAPRRQPCIHRALTSLDEDPSLSTSALVALLETESATWPQHVILELGTERQSTGLFARRRSDPVSRAPMTLPLADRIFRQMAEAGDAVLTLDGVGDPLLHPEFDEIVRLAHKAGVRGVHLRTELLVDRPMLDRLLACGLDVISIDLHADRAATYEAMMAHDRFRDVLQNMDYLVQNRRALTKRAGAGAASLALPWVVPRLQRREETYQDIDTFFDRWMHTLGAAVIESAPPGSESSDRLMPAVTPASALRREARRRMTILCDGSVPVRENHLTAANSVGNMVSRSLRDLWRDLQVARQQIQDELGHDGDILRMCGP